MKFLNYDKSLSFKYVFGAFYCGSIDAKNPNLAEACCGGGGVFYSIEENVYGVPLSLVKISNPEATAQVLIDIVRKGATYGVYNFNLSLEKVIIRQDTNIMTIVDFSDCVYLGTEISDTDKNNVLEKDIERIKLILQL
jgi:hypothetical protein